ncbi:MAG: MFS transporter [Desulfarculaceae bacterium]|nr:MFS transporter [Desulfarculaceae bacterium]MCF8074170.1 MFS transporter [Desulfarculaceae bacterium]MCF8102751.1 MFS transporter [Desulfarculaceae bacterium]MCF8116394.1 MFS transporter [Desulfarculaceae bacterium]
MNPEERRILAVTCFGHFLSHYNMLVFPSVVLPLAALLNLPLAAVLGLSLWQYLLFGLTALPWGLACDRFGAKPLLMTFFLGAGLCGLAAAAVVDDPLLLSLSLAGVGLFSGCYHPAGLGLVARGVKRIARGMAFNGIFGNLGLGASPLITGLVVWLWGPRAGFVALGVLNLAGFGLMAALRVDEPVRAQGDSARSAKGLVGPFVILLTAMMLGGITYRGLTVSLPTYLEINAPDLLVWFQAVGGAGISGNLMATLITAFIFTVGAAGQYFGGWVGERVDPRWGYLTFHAISIPAVFFMAWAANLPLVVLAMIYVFFLLGMQPMENTLVSRLSPPAFQHTAYGTKFVLTFGVGAFAVKAAGWVEIAWGLGAIYLGIGCVTLVLVGAIAVLIWRTPKMDPA